MVRTRKARLIIVFLYLSLFVIATGFWAGAVTGGFSESFRIGIIAMIFVAAVWIVFGALISAALWVFRGERSIPKTNDED